MIFIGLMLIKMVQPVNLYNKCKNIRDMKIVKGIASTTHIDRHGDTMSKSALLGMEEQINDHYIPLDVEHKGIYIGVLLCGKVKRLKDGEWGLYFVAGIFEHETDRKKFQYKKPNKVYKKYLRLIF